MRFTNFDLIPAPVAVLAFLGTAALEIALAAGCVLLFALRRRKAAVVVAFATFWMAVAYGAALLGLALGSDERVVERGELKYICEVDCHLAYSVVAVEAKKFLGDRTARGSYRVVTLRVYFDERTIAPFRPRDLLLVPNSRSVRIVDGSGASYAPDAAGQEALARVSGPQVPLTRSLTPGESFETRLVFDLPTDARDLHLLVTEAAWPTHLLLGHENSFFHAKTSLLL